jgi:hypothetical protein
MQVLFKRNNLDYTKELPIFNMKKKKIKDAIIIAFPFVVYVITLLIIAHIVRTR